MDMDMRDCAAKAPQGFPRNRNNQRFFVFKFLIENKNDGFEEFGVVGIQNQMWVLPFWLVFFIGLVKIVNIDGGLGYWGC